MAAPKRARGKRKPKKNIPVGQAHIKTSFNNTIVSLTDVQGNVIAWESAGGAGFKGSRKSTPFAAQVTADAAARKGLEQGLQKVEVYVKGPGSGRETAIRSLQAAGLEVTGVKDVTPQAHNGCRPRKRRRGEQPPSSDKHEEEHRRMARDTGPQCKQCRREGQKLFLKGERCLTDKCGVERRSYPPGEHGRGRQKQSEYRLQLREKQKAKRYYGVLEKQFAGYYEKASRQSGITGENLLTLLECRLDNVLVRLAFGAPRPQARQLIRHGPWTVNGRRVNIPSSQVRPGDVITIKADTPATQVVRDATELTGQIPAWLQADHESLTAKVLRKPERREVAAPVQEQLIVELYSK